jgi:hypothetical protein
MDKKKTSKNATTTKKGGSKAVKLRDIDLKVPDSKVKGGGQTKQEQTHK